MSPLAQAWSQEEMYYIAERAYRLHCEGRLREAETLFAGLSAVSPADAYYRRALAAVRSQLKRHTSPSSQLLHFEDR
jgi:hypothetical protein